MQLDQATADKAEKVAQTFNSEVQQLRGNADITDAARQRGMARAYVAANRAMAALRETWLGNAGTNEDTLARQLFGSPTATGADAISTRDAADRAAQLETPTEAGDLLASAELTGDETLSRAVAARAFTGMSAGFGADVTGWGAVLDQYAATRPGVIDQLNALDAMQRAAAQGTFAAEAQFALFPPNELANLNDYRISMLAQSSEPAPKAAQPAPSRPDMTAIAGS
jgi:hypothetical protein